MPLEPQAQELLDQMAALEKLPFEQMTVAQAREEALGFKALQGEPEAVARVEDHDAARQWLRRRPGRRRRTERRRGHQHRREPPDHS